MQDLRGNILLFGGATFLFAGDFSQTLPVVTKKHRRAHSADSEFSKILLDVGKGKCPEMNSTHDIELPTGLYQVVSGTETLIPCIYNDVHDLDMKEDSWL
ncbi:ATP-dependent DNA helicase [Trichonephila clavipes]|nr:ATP-dependent DNA helicase [Trichonephila clavipes]